MKDEIYVEGNQPYGEIFLDDFNLLQEAGVPIPHLEEAKAIIQGKK